jgi:hypothetical protein
MDPKSPFRIDLSKMFRERPSSVLHGSVPICQKMRLTLKLVALPFDTQFRIVAGFCDLTNGGLYDQDDLWYQRWSLAV